MVEVTGIGLLIALVGIAAFLIGRSYGPSQRERKVVIRDLPTRTDRWERERQRASQVIEGMTEGVVVVTDSMTPVLANGPARRLLTLPGGELPPTIPSAEVTSVVRRCMSERAVVESDLNWHGEGLNLRVRAVPLEPDGAVVFLRDVTEELRMQKLRRQFVANASHELKTPVASLQTLIEAIQQAVRDDPDTAERFAAQMVTEGERMAALIDDLMDLSRVEDPAAMRLGEVDLAEIVRGEVDVARHKASEAGVRLEADLASGMRIRGDAKQLRLMVKNLIENALTYTRKGGHVTVTLTGSVDRALLEVRDTGIGIPLQSQGRVFERFYRVDEDRARASGGTGLGLAIVKNVAESHAGTVGVTSELDEGSVFTVSLPLASQGVS